MGNRENHPKSSYDRAYTQEAKNNMFQRIRNALFDNKAAAWTALFTLVLTLFTFLLYHVADSTNQTQRISQRAFLTFVGPQNGPRMVENPSDLNSRWIGQEIGLTWTNSGNTPARDVAIQAGAQAFFPDLPEPYDFPLSPAKTQIVLGPKANYATRIMIPKEILSDGIHGKKMIFIWGTATYEDVFPESRERLSEFCVELTHLTVAISGQNPAVTAQVGMGRKPSPTSVQGIDLDTPGASFGGFAWEQCREHNCYDQDCKDYPERIKDMRK